MNILREIVLNKRKEIHFLKKNRPISEIEKSQYFNKEVISLKKSLIEKSGIISEFKRKSPSKPNINLDAEVITITKGYELSNSSGISILTDSKYLFLGCFVALSFTGDFIQNHSISVLFFLLLFESLRREENAK